MPYDVLIQGTIAQDARLDNIQKIAPPAQVFEISAKTGQGIDSLLTYLFDRIKNKSKAKTASSLAINT